jgi:hypothetical protein
MPTALKLVARLVGTVLLYSRIWDNFLELVQAAFGGGLGLLRGVYGLAGCCP